MKTPVTALKFLILTLFASVASAQTYIADSSFNTNGQAIFTFYNNIDRGFGSTIQPDQKLVMVGLSKNPGTGSFELCVARMYLDYTFDSTFSGDGKAYVSMGNQASIGGQAPRVKVDSNGRIVIVNTGRSSTGTSQDMMICRLDSNGVLDNSFNGNGVLFVDLTGGGTQPDMASDFDFDANGNIYLAGVTRTGGTPLDNDFFVVKVKDNGQLDTSFDTDGKKLYNPTGFAEFGTGIRVLSDGHIVFGGVAGANMMIGKIDSTGMLDNTFNGNGYVTAIFGSSSYMYGMELDSLERIVIAGTVQTANTSIGVARYFQNGTPDAGFGTNGKATIVFGNGSNEVTDLEITEGNKILISGMSFGGLTGMDFMVCRIDSSGTLDQSFNGNGYYSKNLVSGNTEEVANSLCVSDAGQIVLTGTIIYGSAINEDVGMMVIRPIPVVSALHEVITQDGIGAFPNPVQRELHLSFTNSSHIQIFNSEGKQVMNADLNSGNNVVDVSKLAPGIYFIYDIQNNVSGKFVKQ